MSTNPSLGRFCLVLALLMDAALCASSAQSPKDLADLRPFLAAAEASTPQYVGPGSCSASACHGGIQPRSATKVQQNEYSTWVTSDKHAHGYIALTEPLGKQIAAILKIGPAEKSDRCLGCHALSVPAPQHAREFDVADGVSCESCHGPASQWLGPHIQPSAKHESMVALGLYDNKDLIKRTEKCLTCHLGTATLSVDHELIAAGHPDLTFELDSFTAVEPPHWLEHPADQKLTAAAADPLFGVRAWAVGEAVELRESMLRLARHARQGPWPEFSEMECISCHHPLTGPQSWRQRAGYSDRRAGDPSYNLARYTVFKHFANEVDPQLNAQLSAEAAKVSQLVTSMSPDRAAVESAAQSTAALASRLAIAMQNTTYDRAKTTRLLTAISADADNIAAAGERTAEQATMTVDSLYIAQTKAGSPNPETRAAIDALFKLVNNPSTYNAPQFAAQLKRLGATLR